jgi:hypothetical protein
MSLPSLCLENPLQYASAATSSPCSSSFPCHYRFPPLSVVAKDPRRTARLLVMERLQGESTETDVSRRAEW